MGPLVFPRSFPHVPVGTKRNQKRNKHETASRPPQPQGGPPGSPEAGSFARPAVQGQQQRRRRRRPRANNRPLNNAAPQMYGPGPAGGGSNNVGQRPPMQGPRRRRTSRPGMNG